VNNFQDEKSAFNFFGRIKRENGKIIGIKEYKDATEEERSIKEVNAGLYIFESDFLWTNLSKLKNENAQGEYYLTDLLKIAKDEGKIIDFEYDPIVKDNGEYFWLTVKCDYLSELRIKYGLNPFPQYGFHLTIGKKEKENDT
jgi:ADP-glucose pyrophosphorylase